MDSKHDFHYYAMMILTALTAIGLIIRSLTYGSLYMTIIIIGLIVSNGLLIYWGALLTDKQERLRRMRMRAKLEARVYSTDIVNTDEILTFFIDDGFSRGAIPQNTLSNIAYLHKDENVKMDFTKFCFRVHTFIFDLSTEPIPFDDLTIYSYIDDTVAQNELPHYPPILHFFALIFVCRQCGDQTVKEYLSLFDYEYSFCYPAVINTLDRTVTFIDIPQKASRNNKRVLSFLKNKLMPLLKCKAQI